MRYEKAPIGNSKNKYKINRSVNCREPKTEQKPYYEHLATEVEDTSPIKSKAAKEFFSTNPKESKLPKDKLHISKRHSASAKCSLLMRHAKATERKSSSEVIKKQLEGGIKKLFKALDLDHNGTITVDDLNTNSKSY